MASLVAARRALLLPAVVATAATPEMPAALAQLPPQTQFQMEPLPLYDCDAEYEMWRTAWTPDWKEWCCRHRQRGCPTTTTVTQTSSTSTISTTTTSTTTTSSTEDEEACEAYCDFENVNATCSSRIAWAVSHTQVSCSAAHKLVLNQCSSCALCSMHLVAKIKECEAEEGRKEEQEEAQEGDEKDQHQVAVFLAKKFDVAAPAGTWSGRPIAALSSPVALVGAAAMAMAVVVVGLRSRRRASEAALLVEVPLTLNEATE
eukprot:CAMPEP_0170213700 /NCGR_PEP_ID=MMETSP0116_2-20130129/6476_1 /TAXON_ID=400756 /ORGANISM="Durinskia baltica, Strain CSIRO CS-38" /LENGTH=259 /DNA_ID=CAMNT_0010464255 /DNA_START=64 /DNA_END=843 /DNA_ORIENTATION=+